MLPLYSWAHRFPTPPLVTLHPRKLVWDNLLLYLVVVLNCASSSGVQFIGDLLFFLLSDVVSCNGLAIVAYPFTWSRSWLDKPKKALVFTSGKQKSEAKTSSVFFYFFFIINFDDRSASSRRNNKKAMHILYFWCLYAIHYLLLRFTRHACCVLRWE